MSIISQVQVDEIQFGLMPEQGTTHLIFIDEQLMEKHLAKKKWHLAYDDLEKVSEGGYEVGHEDGTVWRTCMLIQAMLAFYNGMTAVVRMGVGDSRNFEVKDGPHQGSAY